MIREISIIFFIYLATMTRLNEYCPTAKNEYLIKNHQTLGNDLHIYVKTEAKRLSFIKRYFDIFEREYEKAMRDVPAYVGNPINAFTLIKRLTTDMNTIKFYIKLGSDYAQHITRYREKVKYPTMQDLKHAAEALSRFQNIHDLDTEDIAKGELNGLNYSSPMSACDCYELGRTFLYMEDFKNSVAWMFEALNKYSEESHLFPHSCSVADIIEYISIGFSKLGNRKNALEWIQHTDSD